MKILQQQNGASLVEFVGPDGVTRVIVPTGQEHNGLALQAGIPFGVDWGALKLPAPDLAAVGRELRGAGIWTAADAQTHPREAQAALRRGLSNIISAFWLEMERLGGEKHGE